MKKRKLGQNGPQVSAVGLGCMSFAGFYGPTTLEESFACLDAAHQLGIDFLDTAEVYGPHVSEQVIGDYQKQTGNRFIIATKGGIVPGGARGENNNSEPWLRSALEGSLERLKVDSVELYYIHRRDWSIEIEKVTETLEGFRQEGLIGGFGFSEIAPSSLRRAASVAPVAAVQNEYSLWTRYPDLGLIRACQELGTTFVPFSPVARGMFAEAFPDPAAFGDRDFRRENPRFVEPEFSANCRIIQEFKDFAHSRGWSVAGAAIAWVLDQGEHLVPIPGTRSAAHLAELAEGAAITLADADRAEIDRILPPGFAHGDRYSDFQIIGIERYC